MIKKVNEWRIGQTLFNFFEWLRESKGFPKGQMGERCADIYSISDEDFENYYQEYLEHIEEIKNKINEQIKI
jgi:hypothetical protein